MSQILHLNGEHEDSLKGLRKKTGRGWAAIFLLIYKRVSHILLTKHKNF